MSGQRSELTKIVAFSVDIRSPGKPQLFHSATRASSVNKFKTSKSGVRGIVG